jgi:hypothetical protein
MLITGNSSSNIDNLLLLEFSPTTCRNLSIASGDGSATLTTGNSSSSMIS